ncbi:hypothetical protein BGX38DRAFT_1158504 [Terfezia claveryi]|nr:hypothetical protein BGX38DRAFT_1158504 [Terfezia claveryi]
MSVPEYQGQFYISADGISRDVITTDICRYLGNNARVRPNTDANVYKPTTSRLRKYIFCDSNTFSG